MNLEQDESSVKSQVNDIIEFVTCVFQDYFKVMQKDGCHQIPLSNEAIRMMQQKLWDLQRSYDQGYSNDMNNFSTIEKALVDVFKSIIINMSLDTTIHVLFSQTRMIRNLIYYLKDPFSMIQWGLSQKKIQKSLTSGEVQQFIPKKEYTEVLMKIVDKLYVRGERIGSFARLYYGIVNDMRNVHDPSSELDKIGEIILFFQIIPKHYSIIRKSYDTLDLRWCQPKQKQKVYIEMFETPFLQQMKQYYFLVIPKQFESYEFSRIVEWFGEILKLEKLLIDKTLIFSKKELELNLREILLLSIDGLTNHVEGPRYMLEHQKYDQLEQFLRIVSLEVSNVILVAKIFGEFLIQQIDDTFLELPKLKINLVDAQHIYDQAIKILSLADTICQRFADSELDMYNKDVCRAEFLNSKQKAFEHLLKFNSNLIESIHILIDYRIRSGSTEIIDKLGYFISVYDNREQFFTRYGEMLSLRLIDDFIKYEKAEVEIMKEFKKCVQNEQLIHIQKVLDDVYLSQLITESIQQNKEFKQQVRPYIQKVNLLIISEIQVSTKINKQCSWFLPQKGLEELVQRRRDSVFTLEKNKLAEVQNQAVNEQMKIQEEVEKPQKKIKKIKVNRSSKRKSKDMEIEVAEIEIVEKKKIEESIVSPQAPYCLQILFELSSQILKQYKDHRFLTYPLLTLGVAEVVFMGDYFLQMSTPQMVIALMIDDDPNKKLHMDHLRGILLTSAEDDVMALCEQGILVRGFVIYQEFVDGDILIVNHEFKSLEKKIRTRPQPKNLISQEQQLIEKRQEKQNQQDIIKTYIVRTLKREKRMLIKQLVELITYQASQKFVSSRELVNLIVQQLIREEVYIQLDQNDALYVNYLP